MKGFLWRLAVSMLVVFVAGCGNDSARSPGGVATPGHWPIAGLTLPTGARDAEYSPSAIATLSDQLPRRRRRMGRVPSQPPPPQWNAFFAFEGEPAKVFEHFDTFLAKEKYQATETRDLEVGTENEARNHTFISSDGRYNVSIRYWKISDKPGARPYQLLVRDTRTPPAR